MKLDKKIDVEVEQTPEVTSSQVTPEHTITPSPIKSSAKISPTVVISNFSHASLCVKRIEARNMPNVESKVGDGLGNNNNAYAMLTYGGNVIPVSSWSPRTATHWNAGSVCAWDMTDSERERERGREVVWEDWRVQVARNELLTETLKVVIMDDNKATPHVLIGVTDMPLDELVMSGIAGEAIEVEGILRNPGYQKEMGRVKVTLCLTHPQSETRAITRMSKHPVIANSINTHTTNQTISIAVFAMIGFWIFSLTATFFRSLVNYRRGSSEISHSITIIFTVCQTLFMMICIGLVVHRILGYVTSVILRNILGKHFVHDPYAYNISIGWLSFRGILDKQEIVLHDLTLLNHSSFRKSPFVLYVKELTVTLKLIDVYSFLKQRERSCLRIERVLMETVEVYFERSDSHDSKYSLNWYAAVGEKDERGRTGGGGGGVHAMVRVIVNKIKEAYDPLHIYGFVKPMKESRFAIDMKRLLILDILAHPLDLWSNTHMEPNKSTDITMPSLIMHHDDLTSDSESPGGPRQPVSGEVFGELVGNKIAQILLSENAVKIANVLSATSANKLANRTKM
mmetsp:Transcript_5768/g.5960  ORF Transcript_5768/g.5960 Transcript_5768/m.5960 type:complete len:569 (-) Transcript_5768:244-1950(-)